MNMTAIKYLSAFLLLSTDIVLGQWEVVYPPSPAQSISGISFINPQKGWYSATDGFIYQTINGGVDWALSTAISPDKLLGIAFADSNCGFAYSSYASVHDSIGLVYTTDGGRRWKTTAWAGGSSLIVDSPSKAELCYPRPDKAFASFDDGTIYCSTDTFQTWSVSRSDKFYFLSDYGLPYGTISRLYKKPTGELLALGNSMNAYRDKKITDSVAYLLRFVEEKNTWDTLWCGLTFPIYDLTFINDSTGWMCGRYGAVLKTTDKGRSWKFTRQPSPYEFAFIALRAVDSVALQLVDTVGRMYDWPSEEADLSVITGVSSGSGSRFSFISDKVGFVGGRNGLYRTDDNGTTWKKQTGDNYGELRRLDFADAETGYSVVNYDVYKTKNGGRTWDKIGALEPATLWDLDAIDSSDVWAIGSHAIYHSTDGGVTWQTRRIDSLNLRKVYFFDSSFGVIYKMTKAGDDAPEPFNLVTTDGGITWEKYTLPEGVTGASKLFFIDRNTGWLDAGTGIFKTVDGGKSWVNIMPHAPNSWNSDAYSFHFIDPNTGWVAYYNLLYKTTDGGRTWDSLSLPSRYETYDLHFVNAKVGYAVGFSGDVMSTTDGGLNWSRDLSLSARPYRSISVVRNGNAQTVFIGGDGFMILKKDVPTSAAKNETRVPPTVYSLSQNYPNPFNPSTTIAFSVPARTHVSLKVFDVMGRKVATIVADVLSAGYYSRQWNASGCPSGVYFYRLEAGPFTKTKRLMLIK